MCLCPECQMFTHFHTLILVTPLGAYLAHLTSQVEARAMEFSPSQETRPVELKKSP